MKTTQFLVGLLLAIFVTTTCAIAAPLRKDERIVRDPVTGDYTAYFWADDETDLEMAIAIFVPATKIDPTVRSNFKIIESWNVRYTYTVSNGAKAKQSIFKIRIPNLPVNARISNSIVVSNSDNTNSIEFFESALSVPNVKWSGSGARTDKGVNIGWLQNSWSEATNNFDTSIGIKPNEKLNGFGFISNDLPGVWTAKLLGNTLYNRFDSSYEFPDAEISDITRQMDEIVAKNYIPYNIAAPLIAIPTPFDPAIVLDNLRTHVATWPSKQLADATFAAQLDAEMIAVANAYRSNQPEVARDHIEIMLDMIRREHKDIDHEDDDEDDNKRGEKEHERKATTQPIRIDRLAARVLDFDLKYVLKRMKRDDEGERSHGRKDK